MTNPTPADAVRAAAADIPPGPYSEQDLREQWNAQEADGEDWDSLESCEQLAWAQARAWVESCRHSAALIRQHEAELATTREALRRLVVWGGWRYANRSWQALDVEVVLDVLDWFADGMTGPLPPLPSYIASREALRRLQEGATGPIECPFVPNRECLCTDGQSCMEPTPSAPALPPAINYDCGDGVVIVATNRERTSWAVRDDLCSLNSSGEWEPTPYPSSRSADVLARTRWPSAQAAWNALLGFRAAELLANCAAGEGAQS